MSFSSEYFLHTSDVTFDLTKGNDIIIHDRHTEPWKVTVVDTGLKTLTGGRIKRVQKYIGNEPFMMTYGDGVCDVNIADIVKFHQQHGKMATLTSVKKVQEKGILDIGLDSSVRAFREKNAYDDSPINAGYMVLEPEVLDYIEGDNTAFERDVLEKLADRGELMSYQHTGFWQCMDNQCEKKILEDLWSGGQEFLKEKQKSRQGNRFCRRYGSIVINFIRKKRMKQEIESLMQDEFMMQRKW